MALGQSVIVAMDHGLHWGVYDGFENPRETLDLVLDAEPDGILASVPFLQRYHEVIESHDIDTIATLDFLYDSVFPGDHEGAEIHSCAFSPEKAVEVADAAKVALVFGRDDPTVLEKNAAFVANAAEDCGDVGIPLVVEPTLWGNRADDEFDAEYLENANRLAFELGADILKSPYPGKGFDHIVGNAPQPVYIAGGPTAETDREVLKMVHNATGMGASGVMFGRNIWQRDDPVAVVNALTSIVHEDASVDEAEEYL